MQKKPSESIEFSRPLRVTQARTLDRFAYEEEAGLFHEMGTGKTTEAIALLRAKFNMAKSVTPTLIISPVATLYNWLNEFKINSPPQVVKSVAVLEGSQVDRIDKLTDETKKIFVTNPEFLDMDVAHKLLMRRGIENLIVDECDVFKNHKGTRLQPLVSIADKTKFRVIMSGTPILNSYMDLWAQFRILDLGKTFGQSFYVYRNQYFKDENLRWKGQPGYFPKWVPKSDEIGKEISALIEKKCSRLKKEDCLDLPPLVQMTEHVDMAPDQRKAYESMEAELIAEVSQGVCSATNALTRVLRMQQILSGFIQTDNGIQHFKKVPRLDRLEELLGQLTPNHKVVVWAIHSANYERIREIAKKLKLNLAEVTGESSDRYGQMARFQEDPACRMMLSNPAAGGVGVNFTASSYSLYYSYGYSLRHWLQSLARNHRGGSEIHEKITALALTTRGSIDEGILAALTRKEEFAEDVLDRVRKMFANRLVKC